MPTTRVGVPGLRAIGDAEIGVTQITLCVRTSDDCASMMKNREMRSVAIVGCALLTLALSPNETFAKGKPQHAGKPSHAGGPAKAGDGGEKNHHKAKMHIVRDVLHKRGGQVRRTSGLVTIRAHSLAFFIADIHTEHAQAKL